LHFRVNQYYYIESGDTGAQSIQNARLSLQSSELAPPAHSAASECCPTLLVPMGRTHSLAVEGGGGEPIRAKGQTLWYSRYTV
jgi:hypothetical protein